MTTWNGIDVTVEVAFVDAPTTALGSCTWVDVSAYVRGFTTNRGRRTELGTYSPGTATIRLDNFTRLFDPSNTAGTYYGNLLPMRRVRVSSTVSAVNYPVFTGYILGWPITYPGMVDSVVAVQCVDAFRPLSLATMPGSAYAAEVLADNPINYWPLQDALGAPEWVDVVDSTGDLVPRAPASYAPSVETLDAPLGETTYQTGYRVNPFTTSLTTPAAIEFWISAETDNLQAGEILRAAASDDFFSVKVQTTSNSLLETSSRLDVRYSHGGKTDSTGSGVNLYFQHPAGQAMHVVVVADATTITAYINGRSVGTDTLAAGSWSYNPSFRVQIYSSLGGRPVAHVACYATAPSAARILAHYLAGTHAQGHPVGERGGARIGRILDAIDWPRADRDLSTGEAVLGQWDPAHGTALAALQAIETAEQGYVFIGADGKVVFRDRQWIWTNTQAITSQATFGDSGSEIRYGDITIDGNHLDHVRNVVTVTYPGGSTTTQDDTSVAAYWPQPDAVNANDLPETAGYLARQLGAYRVRARKDPATRIAGLVVDPRSPLNGLTATMPTLLALELGDRVTVTRRPNGSTDPITLACAVQGVAHTVDADTWRTSLYLSPAPKSAAEAVYLVLGDATQGKVGAVAANKVPY